MVMFLKQQTFKWQDYINWQRKLNEARASAAALKSSISGMSSERKPPKSKWKAFFRRSPLEDVDVVVKKNVYDKGTFHNIWEVIYPLSTRWSFSQRKSKSTWDCCERPYTLGYECKFSCIVCSTSSFMAYQHVIVMWFINAFL